MMLSIQSVRCIPYKRAYKTRLKKQKGKSETHELELFEVETAFKQENKNLKGELRHDD